MFGGGRGRSTGRGGGNSVGEREKEKEMMILREGRHDRWKRRLIRGKKGGVIRCSAYIQP